MRLGGPIFDPWDGDAERWAQLVKAEGYRAGFCPVGDPDKGDLLRELEAAAKKHDLVIAEVGAWSNPISKKEDERQAALEKCRRALAAADLVGARCCVNIVGSRDEKWDGPHPENVTDATFDLIVESVRSIVDAVKPTRTFYALETMPWIFPDSAESYAALLKAIDRKTVAVHLDPVNLVNCPRRYYDTAGLIRACFRVLGPQIKSCHAKDIVMPKKLTVHLDECRPGTGALDYGVFIEELKKLDADMPLMLEHLPNREEYAAAREHVKGVARQQGVTL